MWCGHFLLLQALPGLAENDSVGSASRAMEPSVRRSPGMALSAAAVVLADMIDEVFGSVIGTACPDRPFDNFGAYKSTFLKYSSKFVDLQILRTENWEMAGRDVATFVLAPIMKVRTYINNYPFTNLKPKKSADQ